MERRAALHLDRLARVMGEDEHRSMERRVRTPPTLPLRVLVPSGIAELQRPHDLGADPRSVQPREGIVETTDAPRLAGHLVKPRGGDQPLVQPVASVAERCLQAQTLARAETVERDREVMDTHE